MRKRIGVAVCMMAVIIGVWQGLGRLGLFMEFSDIRYYELEEKVSMGTAAAMRAEEAEKGNDLLLWDFLDGQTVSIHTPIERTSRVSVVTVCGNPECLTGNFTVPQCGDTRSCLLDRGTAWELFGTEEATGETVAYQGKEYKIKGILDGLEPTMLIQASAAYDGGFGRMTLAGSGTGDWELENRIRNRYGIALEKIDWEMVRTAVRLAFCVMPLSVCVLVWRKLSKCRRGKGPADKVVSAACAAAGIALVLSLLRIAGIRGIPAAYIPPQWSDFAFYREAWRNLESAWKYLLRLRISTFELKMVQNCAVLCLDMVLTGLALRYLTAALCDRMVCRREGGKF